MAEDSAVMTIDEAAGGFDEHCARWIEGMADGDEAALGELYHATLSRVYGLALRIIGDESLAEDIVTSVYHEAWTGAANYRRERGRPLTWLLTICRSRALDEYRRVAAAARRTQAAERAHIDEAVEPPPDLLESLQSGAAVHAVLSRLSADDRQLIALAFFRDLTHSEIAAQTGQPLGTVKSRLRRSLKSMNKALSDMEPESGTHA